MPPGNSAELGKQCPLFVGRRIAPGEARTAGGAIEVAAGLLVWVHDRQDDLVDRPGQRFRQRGKTGCMRRRVEFAGEDDRVVAPYRGARPKAAAQLLQLGHRLGDGNHRSFEGAGIPGHGELHGKRGDPPHLVEVGQQRTQVAGPEDKAVDRLRR